METRINNIVIGDDRPTFVIAEAGINHNGRLDIAKELVDKAVETGADAIKFQTFKYITKLTKYQLSYSDFVELKFYCDKKNIIFLSTPHTFDAIHFLDEIVPMFKIASTYLTNANFLMEVAKKEKPILLSTGNLMHNNGMATYEEITNALSFIPNAEVILLHCISRYPCMESYPERIPELKKLGYLVGFSDHTKSIKVPKVPVIEKHFMLEDIDCIDKDVSLTPTEFKQMVELLK